MKRVIRVASCALLATALALPAMAKDHSVGGFLRVKGYVSDIVLDKDGKPDMFIDQRFRAKWDININEYVSVTYYGEVDFQYGDSSYNLRDGKRGRNGGGAIGGDQNNVETKHLYMNVKVPETPVSFRLGLQGFAAPDYALFLFDGAGLTVNYKADMFDAQLGYAKLYEGGADSRNRGRGEAPGSMTGADDANFYYLKGTAKPMDALKVGAGLYWVQNQGIWTGTEGGASTVGNTANYAITYNQMNFDEYFLVLDGSYKLDMISIEGWLATAFGSIETAGGDTDLGGYAATVKASGKAAGVGWGARLLYWSGDDNNGDKDIESLYTPFADAAVRECLPFAKDGSMLMLADINTTTYAAAFRGYAMDAAYTGWGLFGLSANGSYSPPTMKKVSLKGFVGYFMSLEDDQTPNTAGSDKKGTSIGTEIAVRANYKLADAVDLSLNGAYAMLGDFYEGTVGNNEDPDDPYMLYWMAQVKF